MLTFSLPLEMLAVFKNLNFDEASCLVNQLGTLWLRHVNDVNSDWSPSGVRRFLHSSQTSYFQNLYCDNNKKDLLILFSCLHFSS